MVAPEDMKTCNAVTIKDQRNQEEFLGFVDL
jgi:hypothetical protein